MMNSDSQMAFGRLAAISASENSPLAIGGSDLL